VPHLSVLLLVASSASANVTATICSDYQVQFTDSDMDEGSDYLATNDDTPARGAKIRAVPLDGSATVFDFAEWNDGEALAPGCVTLSLDPVKQYSIQTCSTAEVNGNTVKIRDSDENNGSWCGVAPGYSAWTPGTPPIDIRTPNKGATHWNAAAAIGHAIYRRAGGLDGIDLVNYVDDATNPCAGSWSCQSGGEVWHGDAENRFGIVHETGHQVAWWRNESQGGSADWSAFNSGCVFEAAAIHEFQRKAFQSAAATEGWADFYAAVAFNSTNETDCGFVYWRAQDYDLDNFSDYQYGEPFDCDFGPGTFTTGLASPALENEHDYLGEVCNAGILTNRATEMDYLRFWWNFVSEEASIEFSHCMDIYDEANPHTWDAGTRSAFPWNWVNTRFRDAADFVLGADTIWVDHSGIDGVHR
jgi:hypothetical protein